MELSGSAGQKKRREECSTRHFPISGDGCSNYAKKRFYLKNK